MTLLDPVTPPPVKPPRSTAHPHPPRPLARWRAGALGALLALTLPLAISAASADTPRRGAAPPPPPPSKLQTHVSWDFGSDRRGRIDVRACSQPQTNTTGNGDCYVRDIADTQLMTFKGETVLDLVEGNEYAICFVSQNTVGRPGTWGACKVITALRDIRYAFTAEDLRYWYGGPWETP